MQEAELSSQRRLGASEAQILHLQSNIAGSYKHQGWLDESLAMIHAVYSGYLRLKGEAHEHTLIAANNLAASLRYFQRFEEIRSLMRKTIPLARRAFGDNDENTLRMRWNYAAALSRDTGATLDDLTEAVETLESLAPLWKRIFGKAHPETPNIDLALEIAREKLAESRASSGSPPS